MRKVFLLCVTLLALLLASCGTSGRTTKVVKPRYHKTYPKNVWRVDIPIGGRHIRFLGRKRTKTVAMH